MNTFRSLCAVGFLARFSYALARNPVLPLFAVSLGAGPEGVGLAVGISTVTGIFFKLPAGALSDVIGRRLTMLAGLFVFGLVPFAYLLLQSYQALVLVRFAHGFATAIYGPVALAVVAELGGARKGEWLSWFSSVGIVGGLLGAPLGGFILHAASGGHPPTLADFRLVYLVSGLTGAACLLVGLKLLGGREDHPMRGVPFRERAAHLVDGLKQVLSDKRVLITSAMEGVQNMSMGALEAFLPLYAVGVAGLNEFEAGLLWGLQIVVTMAVKPLFGRVGDRLGRKNLVIAGMLLCAVAMALIPFLRGFWPLCATALVFGLGEALVTACSAAMVADFCKTAHLGSAMGAFGTIFDVGHAAGPILTGLGVAAFGYQVSFVLLAILLVLSLPQFIRHVQDSPGA